MQIFNLKMKIIIIHIFLFVSISGFTQKPNAALFVSNDHKANEGIQLKWVYNNLYHPDGFILLRKEEGGSWQQITTSPIQVKKIIPSNNGLNKEEKDLHHAVANVSYDEFKTSIVRAFVIIKSIYNNELAEYVGIYYHDKTAVKGKVYEYKLTLKSGEELAVSSKISCSEYKKITAPENLNVFRTKKTVSINWKPELYRYYGIDIYRKNNKNNEYVKLTINGPIAIQPKDVKNLTENSKFFIDTTIVYDDSYTYKLVAIDYFGLESEHSIEVAAPAQDFVPPLAPLNFKLNPSSTKALVVLNWESIDEVDLAGYNIYCSKNIDEKFVKINTSIIEKTNKTFTHSDLLPGGYFYMVSCVDFAGNETLSNMYTTELKDCTPPSPPSNFKTEATSGEIKISWTPNSESDLKGYFIEKALYDSTQSNYSYITVNSIPLKETFYIEKLSKNIKNKFIYRVVAVDTNYNRSKPSINSIAQMPDVIPPQKPVLKNVSTIDGTILIEWLANVESDLAGYDLYRSKNGDTNSLAKVNFNLIPNSLNKYTDRNIEKGVEYSYQLVAKDNSQNESAPSASFSISLPSEKTTANIVVTKAVYNQKKQQVTLQWNIEENIEMKGYVVYQKDALGNMKPISGLSQFKEYVTKDINTSILEFEIRGYTLDGGIIKTNRIILNT